MDQLPRSATDGQRWKGEAETLRADISDIGELSWKPKLDLPRYRYKNVMLAFRSLRIAMITERFPPLYGGAEIRYYEIARRLAARGHDVHVFTTSDGALPSEANVEGFHVHRIRSFKNYIAESGLRSMSGVLKFSISSLGALGRWGHFDVYEFNQWPLVPAVLDRIHYPRVITWYEVWDGEYAKYGNRMQGTFGSVLESLLAHSRAQAHVTVSSLTQDRLKTIHGVSRNVIEVPTGVDADFYAKIRTPKVYGRICYVGRIVPHKHVHDWLLDAFRIVQNRHAEVELHVVGEGPLARIVRKKSAYDSRIYVHGRLPPQQMAEVLCSSSVFVLASEREGLPNSVMEAMASGTPVVAVKTAMSGVDEVVIDGTTGKLVQANPESIAVGILQILEDRKLWELLARNGARLARRYDWEVVTDRMEAIYRTVAHETG